MARVAVGEIGGRLREAREQRRLTVDDVARRTKLPRNVIESIERNDFARLPGGMFRKAYVRTLAAELGLDGDQLADQYQAAFVDADTSVAADHQATLQHQWVEQLTPSPRRSVLALVVLALPAVAWFMLQRPPVAPAPSFTDTAGHVEELRAGEPGQPALIAVENATTPLSIAIEAIGWCWIAADADGRRVLYRLVAPGERLLFEGERVITLRLGDAGAVMVSINDGNSRSFGNRGEVVALEVTPDNVEGLRDGVSDAAS